MAHAVGKENGDRAAAAVRNVDCGSGVDSDIRGMHIRAIVLKGEAWLAAGRKLVDKAGGCVSDIDDGFSITGHGDGLIKLAGAITVGAPCVHVLECRWRRLLSSNGLRWTRAAGN